MSKKLDRSDIDHFQDNDIHVPTRTLYMGPIHSDAGTDCIMAERIIKNLHILDNMYDPEKPITIITNNPGGDVEDGMAIYDAIIACRSHIDMVVYGKAYSMASIILQAADNRILAPNAKVMIHYGTFGAEGHPKMVKNWLEENSKFDKWMENLFLERIHLKHPDLKKVQLQRMMDFDKVFNAFEAVEIGLADSILGDSLDKA